MSLSGSEIQDGILILYNLRIVMVFITLKNLKSNPIITIIGDNKSL